MNDRQLRWVAVSVLFIASALNYLDRSVLSALMPTLRQEFGIAGAQLGGLIAAFSIPYALAAPLMGMLIDRAGLRRGASIVVGLWSTVCIATGFAGGFGSLLVYRGLLGLAESGGIPAAGKGSAVYLESRDRALGSAISQIGISLGSMTAPVLTEVVSAQWGWRSAFVAAGLPGFLWIPLWLWTSKRIPPPAESVQAAPARHRSILRDTRFWALIAANGLLMTVYSVWTNWMTDFLVTTFHLTQKDANLNFAWIPPIFATLGGLFGGVVAQRLIRGDGMPAVRQRLRISTIAALFVLAMAVAPVAGSPGLAVACICLSYFAVLTISVNYYSIPLDLYGSAPAAFAVSFLVGVYGLMQAFLAPSIGRWTDLSGWQPVCLFVSILPLASVLLLRTSYREA